jgi:hypothetical protein
LRDLHRGHEKDEKDKERAKSEVARLNGLVTGGGSGSGASSSSSPFGRGPTPSISKPQATAAQRKQQLAQLAEMGVSIPDEFRPDMAMAGEWQITEERIIEANEGEKKPDAVALGVRKRAIEDEEEEAAEANKRRWGSIYRTQPTEDEDEDLDALLGNVTGKGKGTAAKLEVNDEVKVESKEESNLSDSPDQAAAGSSKITEEKTTGIKREPEDGEPIDPVVPPLDTSLKQEVELKEPEVIFKKRKAKNIRQR